MIVITPQALTRSGYKPCSLGKLKEQDADESFVFVFPSPDPINQTNGDGELYEIHDFSTDYSWILTERGEQKTLRGQPITKDTTVYFRGAYGKRAPARVSDFRATRVVVEGIGEFPYDMLRYDEAWPETQEDAGKLAVHDWAKPNAVRLRNHSGNWTPARWESFGWKIKAAP